MTHVASRQRWAFVGAIALLVTVISYPAPSSAGHNLEEADGDLYHWADFATYRQVTFVDRTQLWPVTTATSNWDRSDAWVPGIVHYHWWNCTHGVNCVDVIEYSDASALYLGITFIFFDDSNGHLSGATGIEFNNYYVPSGCDGETAAVCRRHTACQEIGHALGLDHQYGPSCMDDLDISELRPEYENGGHDDHDPFHTAYDHGYHG